MRFSSTLLVGSVVAAATAISLSGGQLRSLKALDKIMGRQLHICTPVVNPTCATSCGEGYVTCVSFPTCYNPGKGDICCSDGNYCLAGEYCTDAGCCPDGTPLSQCGGTVTLSIILPVTEPTSTSAAPTTSAAVTTTTSSSAVITTSSTSSKSSSSTTSSSDSSSSSSTSSTTTTRPTTTRGPSGGSGTTTTATTSPIFTGAAQAVGVGAAQVALGGLAMFMML